MLTRRLALRRLAMATVASAVPVARPAAPATKGVTSVDAGPRDSSFDPWVEIRPDHLRHNVAEIRRRVAGRPIIAVIKNNGYGLGIENVGRLLGPRPEVAALAVIKLHEAVVLREAGVRKPILLMGPFDEPDLEEALAHDIDPMVYTPVGATLDRLAQKRQRPANVHVCVDTGIGRVGVPFREAPALVRDLASRRSVRLAGTMMTLTEDPAFDGEQVRRFVALCAGLEREGIGLGLKHAASSFALFQRTDAFFDAVRPGMAVFGVYPEPGFRTLGVMDLRPAVSLKARVAYVKRLMPGDSAGYNRAYVAQRDVWVATLPVGHADGWPRVAARGARVTINGTAYPVIASVSARHTIVEVGAEPRVAVGDVATLFGWVDGARPEDVGASCGASVYDLTMHLNPLLPRRVV